MTTLRLVFLVLLAAFLAMIPKTGVAVTNCTAAVTDMNFGDIDDRGADVTATLTYECQTEVLISWANQAHVEMCLAIGAGSQPGSTVHSRLMRNSQSDPLGFQIYRDESHSQIWGNTAPTNTRNLRISYGLNSILGLGARGQTSGTVTVYGRVPAQAALAAGDYGSRVADADVIFRYKDTLLGSPPTSCMNGGTQGAIHRFSFSVNANVPDHCTISTATDLSFGSIPGLIDRPYDQTSSISLSCTRRTPWNIHLDDGQNADGNVRRMRMGAGNYVVYELYRNAGRTQRWGTQKGVDTVPGTGEGSGQTVTVHGRVPAGQQVPAGEYRDTVTVTVTY